jgi:hypothetical protein
MFVWVHYRKSHGVNDFTVDLLVDGVSATSVYRVVDEDLTMLAQLFWIAAPSTGAILVEFSNPSINGVFYGGTVHIVGACLNGMNQTIPIIAQLTSFNVQNNGFSFPASTNHLLLPGLVMYSKTNNDLSDVPFPTAYPGSDYSATILQSRTAPPYTSDGACALGWRVGASAVTAGWTIDQKAVDDDYDWWNIAVALRGV